jgi:hypothetical protein
MNIQIGIFVALFSLGSAVISTAATATEPKEVVLSFAKALIKGDGEEAISHMTEALMEQFRDGVVEMYLVSNEERRKLLLSPFGVDQINSIRAMKVREFMTKFFKSPIGRHLRFLDGIGVQYDYEIETIKVTEDRATLKLRITRIKPEATKEQHPSICSLVRIEEEWKIEGFTKDEDGEP